MVAMPTPQPLRRLSSLLRDLGYRLLTSRRRSLRQLFCLRRMPPPVFFTSFPGVIYFKRLAQATLDNVRLAKRPSSYLVTIEPGQLTKQRWMLRREELWEEERNLKEFLFMWD